MNHAAPPLHLRRVVGGGPPATPLTPESGCTPPEQERLERRPRSAGGTSTGPTIRSPTLVAVAPPRGGARFRPGPSACVDRASEGEGRIAASYTPTQPPALGRPERHAPQAQSTERRNLDSTLAARWSDAAHQSPLWLAVRRGSQVPTVAHRWRTLAREGWRLVAQRFVLQPRRLLDPSFERGLARGGRRVWKGKAAQQVAQLGR
jgi:hypothetical protein